MSETQIRITLANTHLLIAPSVTTTPTSVRTSTAISSSALIHPNPRCRTYWGCQGKPHPNCRRQGACLTMPSCRGERGCGLLRS